MADKHKILIVEDDKYIINFISMSLKKEDYDYVILDFRMVTGLRL